VREPALALGITELNPNLVAADRARPVPRAFARWRQELERIRPAYYRLVLDWARLQPRAGAPADLDRPDGGCGRLTPPCGGFAGVRDQLRALAARQREGGWEALVVVTDTPAWAAAPLSGCTLGSDGARSAALRPAALPAYRALVAAVLDLAGRTGARLRWWSPWNEPNHPYFLAPQRDACRASAASRPAAAYAQIAGALREALAAAPGDQELALGELAGVLEPTGRATSIGELIGALPRELVCAADVWTQHAYVGGRDPVDAVDRALAARACARRPPIWITETGVGAADSRLSIARGIRGGHEGCRRLQARLVRWWRDPRVAAAFQYTFREDPAFPTGLVSTDLDRARAPLAVWQEWGARSRPDEPPPRDVCGVSRP
jgi:hypothetical protein